MARKPRFKPEIRRVRLNPEQAVLACACYFTGWRLTGASAQWFEGTVNYCSGRASGTVNVCFLAGAGGSDYTSGATSS